MVLTVLIGLWASRKVKSSDDYILAGRSLPLFISSSALFATWFGSETVFGASSEFLQGGLYAVIEDPFGAALCLILFGMFFARKLYAMNLLTLGDFFKIRYGRQTELISSLFLAVPYIGYIAAQLVAMGLILTVVTGMVVWQGVVISAVVVTIYTYIGGMWAITITDFIQTIIIIIGLLALAFVLSGKAGGVAHVLSQVPPEHYRFLPKWNSNEIITYLAAWSVLGLGSLPSQDVFQRAMSSSSAKIAMWSCFIGALLYLTIAMLPLFISICTQYLYPEQITDTQLALPMMVLLHTSLPIQILFFGSLLSAIMSTTSSAILAPASIFSENLIKPLIRNRYSDKQLLMLTRLSVLIFSGFSTVLACMRSNIYELVALSSILSLVSLFAPLVFGLYWRYSNSVGALLSMVLGMLTWIIFEFLYEISWPSLVPATLISIVSMMAGSLMWSKRNKYDNYSAQSIK
jgi:SSS family solute:Na+ symporter